MKTQIENILASALPTEIFTEVREYKQFGGSPALKISIAMSDHNINQVRGQHPQLVTLCLELETMALYTQSYACQGGGSIYRNPNKEVARERYLAMQNEKVPFRRPKAEEKFVLGAVKRFAENYIKTLKKHREVLRYQDIVDYSVLGE